MADYWMKLYIEILDDPKMATLPDRVWRRVIELFLCAKRLNKDGHLPDTRQIAWMLRMNPDELDADMSQIAMTGIVVREVGGWFIPKFKERQDAVPAKERKAQQRERDQARQYYGDVTNQSRNVTQSREQNTENREQNTETEEKGAPPCPADPFDNVQRIFEAAGVLVNTPAAIKAVNEIVKMGADVTDIQNGLNWKIEHNEPDKVIFASSLVGPIKTAVQKREQKTNGRKSTHVFQETF